MAYSDDLGFTPAYTSEVQTYVEQARDAVRRGASPEAVASALQPYLAERGIESSMEDIMSSIVPQAPEVEQPEPEGGLLSDIGALYSQAYSAVPRIGQAVTGLAAGAAHQLLPDAVTSNPYYRTAEDAMFSASDELGELSDRMQQAFPEASPLAKGAGLLAGELVASPARLFNEPASVLQKGGDLFKRTGGTTLSDLVTGQEPKEELPSAYEQLAREFLVAEGGLALGLPFKGAAGLAGVAKRAGVQVPGSVALGKLYAELTGQDYTFKQGLLDAALGGLGGIAREPAKPTIDVELGKEAGDKLIKDAAPESKAYDFEGAAERQQALLDSQKEPSLLPDREPEIANLFDDSVIPAATAEARRTEARTLDQEREASLFTGDEPPPSRTALDQAELERQYLFDQQERLREQQLLPQEPLESVPELPRQHDLGDFGVPPAPEAGRPRARLDAEGNVISYTEDQPNNAMREALQEAGISRGVGLDRETPNIWGPAHAREPDFSPAQPEVFEPTRTPSVEQPVPEQAELPMDNDLFGQQEPPDTTSYIPATERLKQLQEKAKTKVLSAKERKERKWIRDNRSKPGKLAAASHGGEYTEESAAREQQKAALQAKLNGLEAPSFDEAAPLRMRAEQVPENDVSKAGLSPEQKNDKAAVKAAAKEWEEKHLQSSWFKRWFGDWENSDKPSGIKDKDGTPRPLYHGTRATNKFSVFDPGRGDFGTHVGTFDQAKDFLNNPSGLKQHRAGSKLRDWRNAAGDRLLPVFVNIRNPLRMADTFWGNPHHLLNDLISRASGETQYVYAGNKASIPPLSETESIRLLNAIEESPELTSLQKRLNPWFSDKDRKHYFNEITKALEKAGYDGIVYENLAEGKRDMTGTLSPEDSYIALHPEQIKSFAGNRGTFEGPNIFRADGGQPTRLVPPASIRAALANNTLTSGDVLRALTENEGGMFTRAEEARAWGDLLSDLADKFGGKDAQVRLYDENDPQFQKFVDDELLNDPKRTTGFYDPETHTIWLHDVSKNNMATMVHETGHAILYGVIRAGENGQLTGKARAAFDRLQSMKRLVDEAWERGQDDLVKTEIKYADSTFQQAIEARDRRRPYGFTDLHEMFSEIFSNQKFRDTLRSIEITDEISKNIKGGRGVLGKARNLYDAILSATGKLFRTASGKMGVSDTTAKNALDLMFSSGMDVFNNAKWTDQWFPHSEVFPQKAQNAPALRSKSEMGVGPPIPQGQSATSRVWSAAKSMLASSQGKALPIRDAASFLKNTAVAGRTEAQAEANKWLQGLRQLSPDNRAKAESYFGAVVSDATSPEAKSAVRQLRALNPAMADVVTNFASKRFEMSKSIADYILSSSNPTAEQLELASTILEQANSYTKRSYSTTKELKQQYALARKAQQKAAVGKSLSLEEAELLNKRDAAIDSVSQSFLNGPRRDRKQLEEQYRLLTALNPDDQFKGLPKGKRRQLMEAAVAEKLASITDMRSYAAKVLDDMSGMSADRKGAINRYYKGLRMGSGILAKRSAVSPEVRAWWGEIITPSAQAYTTLVNQYNHEAAIGALDLLAKEGLKSGLLTNEIDNPSRTAELSGAKLGALQGLRTTPEAKQAIDSVFEANSLFSSVIDGVINDPDAMNAVMRMAAYGLKWWSKGTSATKTLGVVYNPGSWVRNAVGSPMQLMSNGNINPAHWVEGIRQMSGAIGLEGRTSVDPKTLRNLRLGILEASQVNEAYGPQSRRILSDLVKASDNNPTTLLKSIKDKANELAAQGESGLIIAKELYGAQDLWTKLANFENELAFRRANFAKRGIKMTEDELERYVANLINDTNITPSRAPRIVNASERIGTTRYASYYTEVARTVKNNLIIGAKDMAEGMKLGDSDLMWHGAKRILGTAAAVSYANALYSTIIKGAAGAIGLTLTDPTEDESNFLEKDTFAKGGNPILWKDGDNSYYFDVAMIGPYDPVWKVAKAAAEAAANPEDWERGAGKVWESIADLGSSNALITNALKAASGKTPSMARRDPETYKSMVENLKALGVGPETADRLINIMQVGPKVLFETHRGAHEQGASTATKVAMGSGIGVERLAPTTTIANYLGGGFQAELRDARKNFTSLVKSVAEASPQEIEEGFVDSMKDIVEPYGKLEAAVELAKAQGKSDEDIVKALKVGRVPSATIGMLMSGKAIPAAIVFTDLKASAEQDILRAQIQGTDPEATIRKWQTNMSILGRIANKYRNTTVEDILNG